ncbi:F-box-like domain superfamily, partial [Arabidopsis thaliana x Arabidopsis arenosa]
MSQGNQRSSSSTTKGEYSESIPNDLILEILSRLPAESIVRFRCVSKLWGSMLRLPHFTKLFLTRYSARPRILFGVEGDGEWLFYSSPHPPNPYEKSLAVAAKFHSKFRGQMYHEEILSYASGFIYFPDFIIAKEDELKLPLICNVITGQYAILPEFISHWDSSFLGFDPIGKQFKVWAHNKILTLGTEKLRWRKNFRWPAYYRPESNGICINGVLYYIGKLCGITWKYDVDDIELCMSVLEDAEKQEWSKYVYTLPENEFFDDIDVCYSDFVVGVTGTGEIVLSLEHIYKEPFHVFYFNPERNTLQIVEIQGFENGSRVYAFVDQVEDLNAYDAKQLKS